jgi:hypothetical protein
MNYSPNFTIALRQWFTSAADRPAGTREALPGTMLRNFRSAFSSQDTCYRAHVSKKVFIRREASA